MAYKHKKHEKKCEKKHQRRKFCDQDGSRDKKVVKYYVVKKYKPKNKSSRIPCYDFAAELYNRPDVHRTAAELEGNFYYKNYLNDNLRGVRTAAELKPNKYKRKVLLHKKRLLKK